LRGLKLGFRFRCQTERLLENFNREFPFLLFEDGGLAPTANLLSEY
jgi:hypothetical protein